MCTPRKINAILLNIKTNRPKLESMCRYKLATYWQNFTKIYLTRVKILQKVLGGLLFLTRTVHVSPWSYCVSFVIWYKPLVGISLNVNWLDFEVTRSRSLRDRIWSDTHFQRNFLLFLQNVCILMKPWCHSYSLPGLHDADDILKVISLNVKVTHNIFGKCNLPVEGYRSTVHHWGPSN